jgi:alpha-D-xyloside xylohydrolase
MANPFPQDVQWDLSPFGPFESFDAGPLQGRIYKQSGHMELAGPDLAGAPDLVVIRIAPPAVQTLTGVAVIGATATARPLANGIELKQQLGAGQITSRLTFPHDGVMRFEVIDWGGSKPQASALAIVSTANEHVYGFGERFITFDQRGRRLQTLTFDDPA